MPARLEPFWGSYQPDLTTQLITDTRLDELEARLGVTFRDRSLLNTALVHASFVNENPEAGLESNERVEFLGDAVLGLVVTTYLFETFHSLLEGDLTRLRAHLVRRDTLARVARAVDLGAALHLSKGEERSGGRTRVSVLGRALEAVIGAIYLDGGIGPCRDLALRLLQPELAALPTLGKDEKSALQEITQRRTLGQPVYRLVETSGPPHHRAFTVDVLIAGVVAGRGQGPSKRLAEMAAARDALAKLSSD